MAWTVGGLSIALLVAGTAVMFLDRGAVLPSSISQDHWDFSNVLNNLVNVAVPALGIVLASRRPRNPIGWLFLSAGLFLSVTTFTLAYSAHAMLADPGSLPAGRLMAWIEGSFSVVPLAMLAFLFLLFPTGHLPSRRWRPVAWWVGLAFSALGIASLVGASAAWSDPFAPSTQGGLAVGLLFAIAFITSLLLALASVVVRFRGSVGDERLQLKWFVTAAVVVVATFVLSFFTSTCNECQPPAWITVLQSLAFILLWAAIAIAVLKYRLYEIDVVISKAVLYGSLAVFITVVYVGLVAGIGSLAGHRGSPLLSAVAAAVIAVAFQPIREWSRRLANRVVYGKRATPYEILGEFSSQVGDTIATDEVLPRMAQILAEGTGAARADVWLHVVDELRDEASWPKESARLEPVSPLGEDVSAIPADLATAVVDRGELLGAISITKRAGDPLTSTETKLVTDLASQAGLVLRNAKLTGELLASLEELRASRQRIVTAQDEGRRRLERNIHDGAQQQLVAMAVKERLLEDVVKADPERALEMIAQLRADTADALETLRDLARGIYPPLLADQGLAAALEAQSRKSVLPTAIEAIGLGRYPQEAEAAVYFCTLEALQNVAKYAQASRAVVRLSAPDGHLLFSVQDDGVGFEAATTRQGTGLQGMLDRLSALGGDLTVSSTPGSGTLVEGRVPIDAAHASG
ncbi:MAG TPA: sensor histidine kinase [Actinomycetota bacterium]